MRARAILTCVAVLLGGCATDAIITSGLLRLGELEVFASDKSLAGDVRRQLLAHNDPASVGVSRLQVSETTGQHVLARAQDGTATKLRLTYTLTFHLERDGVQVNSGDLRRSLTIDNDINLHSAILAEQERFWTTARNDSINNMVSKLQLLELP